MNYHYFHIETNMLLFAVGVIIACLFFTMRSIAKKNAKENPHHILEQKFSRGEIDAYKYNQVKRQLQRDEDLKIKTFLLSIM